MYVPYIRNRVCQGPDPHLHAMVSPKKWLKLLKRKQDPRHVSGIPQLSPQSLPCTPHTPRHRYSTEFETPISENDSVFSASYQSPFEEKSRSRLSTPRSAVKGPKVRAFIFTQANQNTPKPRKDSRCFICEELLCNKLAKEVVVALKCGHFTHSECLELSLDYNLENAPEFLPFTPRDILLEAILPLCEGEGCLNKSCKAFPVDQEIFDALISRALVRAPTKKNHETNHTQLLPSPFPNCQRSLPEIPKPVTPLEKVLPIPPEEVLSFSTPPLLKSKPYFSKLLSPIARRPKDRINSTCSSQWYPSTPSPNPSVSTINTFTVKMDHHKNVPIDTLKNHLIQILFEKCPNFGFTTLLTLGSLRLVDELLASFNGVDYSPSTVFFFDNYLVVSQEDEPILVPLRETNITTPSSSGIKFLHTAPNPLEVWLDTKVDTVIEKWVVATLDHGFEFPVELITSTISVPVPKDAHASVYLDIVHEQLPLSVQEPESDSTFADEKTPVLIIKMIPQADNDSDSDSDSDVELINRMANKLIFSNKIDSMFASQPQSSISIQSIEPISTEWNDLISRVDRALSYSL